MKASRTSLFIFLIMISLCLVNTQPVKSQSSGTIYIRSDGSVEGTDKIQRDGNVYTFTGDIGTDEWSYGIMVERDNIVIDGAGYLLKGHGQFSMFEIFALGKPIIHGINLEGRNNVTIKNLQIWGFNCGFWGNCCTKIKILDNNLTKIATNVILQYCSHNIISGNTMINNGTDGIYFYQGHNNTITKNYIKDNRNGIHAYQFSNSTISGNKIAKNTNGIYLDDYSMCNLVSGNTLANNTHGIGINSCFNNTVSGNNITNNSHYGIWLAGQSSNNTITENNITNNAAGISIREASNNKLFKNNFINNIQQVYDVGVVSPNYASPSINNWDTNAEGNYWSDYNGTDNDGDGIGDTSYIIDENNQDNYPLMNPIPITEFPDTTPPTISIVSPENNTYSLIPVHLKFTVSKSTSWIGYSLDGQANLTITGNTTISGLPYGHHSLVVYATDTDGNTGASETIYFTAIHWGMPRLDIELFPQWAAWAVAVSVMTVMILAVAGAIFLVYFAKVRKTTGEEKSLRK